MIRTYTGANSYQLHQALTTTVEEFAAAHTSMAVEQLDGEESGIDRISESLQSLPFLTTRKLVILHSPSKQKAFSDDVAALLGDIPETTDVVIVEPKIDKRLSYYKFLKKQTDFQEFSELDSAGLARWAGDYVKNRQGTLSPSNAKLLIDRVGTSQQMMQHELDKLLLYNPEISSQTITLLTDHLPQSTIFELLDATFAGNLPRAMALYAEQRALKVEPQAIIALLAWQLTILATIKAAGTMPIDEIAKTAGLNPFVVRKSQSLARKLSLQQLKEKITLLTQLDHQLKRVAIDPDEAVQLFLLRA